MTVCIRMTRRTDAEAGVTLNKRRRWYDGSSTDGQQGDSQPPNTQTSSETHEELTWEAWLAQQPEEQRKIVTDLYAKQTGALQSALHKEREDRKAHERQLRDLAKAQDEGSEAQKKLTDMADQVQEQTRRADFYEHAADPKIGLIGAKAAWTIMNDDAENYFDKRGNPDFTLLKQEHPYLFAQPKATPKANAGTGTDTPPSTTQDMNATIRHMAGRR